MGVLNSLALSLGVDGVASWPRGPHGLWSLASKELMDMIHNKRIPVEHSSKITAEVSRYDNSTKRFSMVLIRNRVLVSSSPLPPSSFLLPPSSFLFLDRSDKGVVALTTTMLYVLPLTT